jgi:ADP-L-glycero-D-manno-heptose 6-epimerase
MVILTGAAGFIGSCMLTALNDKGYEGEVCIVDDFTDSRKAENLKGKVVHSQCDRTGFLEWFETTEEPVSFVIHIGARTDTALLDVDVFNKLNLHYTQKIWQICAQKHIPLIYASSAATYGDGANGFHDGHDLINQLRPLNPYGESKHQFDIWALRQIEAPPFWMGCKFFNVYGPNEYHKGRMASVIFHTFHQILQTGKMKLFKSHRPGIADGHQSRDFVSVMDVMDMLLFAMDNHGQMPSGIYNVGSGQARTFLDLATLTFQAMDLEPRIEFIDTPVDIRDAYQYFTEADMSKMASAGYARPTTSLEEGIDQYVRNYLAKQRYY